MCRGERLLADFKVGTEVMPSLPEQLEEHVTMTVDGLWVVWAYKVALQADDLFIPLTGGPGYPADATATCRKGRAHDAPHPRCTCGFHAVSSRSLPGLPVRRSGFSVLTVALSGRVLAFEWESGQEVLWRAERQTVVRVDIPDPFMWTTEAVRKLRHPDDPDGRLAAVSPGAPRDSGPVRLDLPRSCPVLPVSNDDAGWCIGSSRVERPPASLVLA